MITRRDALTLTAGAAVAPLAASAATEPFVLPERLQPTILRVAPQFELNSIHVMPSQHQLFFVMEPGRAIRYGVGVGQAGLEFKGIATVDVKKEWPEWRPTDEMIDREPETYARFIDNDYVQPGGQSNTLGARALYLFQNGVDTFYRIHGTNQPQTIGRSVSNGCIRMLNDHVVDLYERVPIGARVWVY
jgi:lipoprotein-anchoring transpeptidase ErfK/SrfK